MTAAVRPVAERLAAVHGLVLWDVSFLREAGRETLRISCDRVGGVRSDELAGLAEDLSRELDHGDAVPGEGRYVLEVTSPGAERRLHGSEQFVVCLGRDARVALRDGRVVEGKIAEATETVVEIETEEGAVRVFLDDIGKAQLVVAGSF
ncbi:MAG: ribosome maturation factor RimP [Actinomycetota bacterium]